MPVVPAPESHTVALRSHVLRQGTMCVMMCVKQHYYFLPSATEQFELEYSYHLRETLLLLCESGLPQKTSPRPRKPGLPQRLSPLLAESYFPQKTLPLSAVLYSPSNTSQLPRDLFPQFDLFPVEIRRQIWEEALPHRERVISVEVAPFVLWFAATNILGEREIMLFGAHVAASLVPPEATTTAMWRTFKSFIEPWETQRTIASISKVCREARMVVQSIYPDVLDLRLNQDREPIQCQHPFCKSVSPALKKYSLAQDFHGPTVLSLRCSLDHDIYFSKLDPVHVSFAGTDAYSMMHLAHQYKIKGRERKLLLDGAGILRSMGRLVVPSGVTMDAQFDPWMDHLFYREMLGLKQVLVVHGGPQGSWAKHVCALDKKEDRLLEADSLSEDLCCVTEGCTTQSGLDSRLDSRLDSGVDPEQEEIVHELTRAESTKEITKIDAGGVLKGTNGETRTAFYWLADLEPTLLALLANVYMPEDGVCVGDKMKFARLKEAYNDVELSTKLRLALEVAIGRINVEGQSAATSVVPGRCLGDAQEGGPEVETTLYLSKVNMVVAD